MGRVLIVGTSGAGKSTLARTVAVHIGVVHYASDDFYWERDWQPASIDRVDRLLDEVLDKPSWVLDGNFEHRWEDVWNRADQIIWLDYSLPVVLWQVVRRNVCWLLSRRVVWSGNRMTLRRAVSGVRHSLRSHGRKRRQYPQYIAQLRHGRVLRFSSRKQTRTWLSLLAAERRVCEAQQQRRPHNPPCSGRSRGYVFCRPNAAGARLRPLIGLT